MADGDEVAGAALLRDLVPAMAHDPHCEPAAGLLIGLALWEAAPRSPLAARAAPLGARDGHLLDRVGRLLAFVADDPVPRGNLALARLDTATGMPGADDAAPALFGALRLAPASLARVLFLARRALRGFPSPSRAAATPPGTMAAHLLGAADPDVAMATLVWDAMPNADAAAQAVSLNRHARLVAEAAADPSGLSDEGDVAALLARAAAACETAGGLADLRPGEAATGRAAEARAAVDRLLAADGRNRLAVAHALSTAARTLGGAAAAGRPRRIE